MFKCDHCHQSTQPYEKVTRVVTETRVATYPYIYQAHKFRHRDISTHSKKINIKDDPGGAGTQIVHEMCVCPSCAAKLTTQEESHAATV